MSPSHHNQHRRHPAPQTVKTTIATGGVTVTDRAQSQHRAGSEAKSPPQQTKPNQTKPNTFRAPNRYSYHELAPLTLPVKHYASSFVIQLLILHLRLTPIPQLLPQRRIPRLLQRSPYFRPRNEILVESVYVHIMVRYEDAHVTVHIHRLARSSRPECCDSTMRRVILRWILRENQPSTSTRRVYCGMEDRKLTSGHFSNQYIVSYIFVLILPAPSSRRQLVVFITMIT